MTDEEKYRAIAACDAACDGLFYYGVVTTGIYCRPSCPSRTPKRENLCFFASREEAEAAGFRPCKRCRPGGGPGLQPQSTADPDPLPPGGGPGRAPGGLRRRPRPEGAPPFAGGPHSRIAPPYKKDPCAHGPFYAFRLSPSRLNRRQFSSKSSTTAPEGRRNGRSSQPGSTCPEMNSRPTW